MATGTNVLSLNVFILFLLSISDSCFAVLETESAQCDSLRILLNFFSKSKYEQLCSQAILYASM